MKIFKTFLKGLLYVVLSPLIIAGSALYTVYSLFVYLYEFIVATIKFFGGSKLTTETKEDLKVDICSNCHPFFTGKQKLVDAGGRVDRFNKRYNLSK